MAGQSPPLPLSRFAQIGPWPARLLGAALLGLTAYGVAATRAGGLIEHDGHGEDAALYAAVVADMRQGQDYYQATERELRARGYAMQSVFNWRLPTLALLFSALPSPAAARGLLGTLALLTLVLWFAAVRRRAPPAAAFAACALLLGICAWPFVGRAYLVHETWAGVAIALSLAAAALERKLLALFAGLAALAIREQALLYVLPALLLALAGRRPREAAAWALGLALFCTVMLLHARVVALHQRPGDVAQATGWLVLGGWRFVLKTALGNFWLGAAPGWLAALLWPLSLLGLLGWRAPLGTRTAATVLVFVGAFLFVGLPYNHLWGLLYAGLVPLGLVFAPSALRDLLRRAFPRAPHPAR
jgi:hypothetical protein